MPVSEVPGIPADAVDVTKEVTELQDQLHELFKDKDVAVIGMALGGLIGETFDDPETIKGLLSMISDMAANVFMTAHCTAPEGTTIQ